MVWLKVDHSLTDSHVGFVTERTLRNLRILNRQWIAVNIKKPNVAEQRHQNVVKGHFELAEKKLDWYCIQISTAETSPSLYTDERHLGDDTIYVSQSALFNVTSRCPEKFKGVFETSIEIEHEVISELSHMQDGYACASATISMVSCPRNNIQDDIVNVMLKEHFDSPKLICENEVFCVPVRSHHTSSQDIPRILWFRVESYTTTQSSHVHQNNGRFLNQDTELVLKRACCSSVPYCSCMVKNQHGLFTLFMSPYVRRCFPEYLSLLTKCLKILQTGKITTANATVLVEAPVGYGKGVIAQMFCFDHGMHFVEEDCLDIVSESFAVTEKKIQAVVENAQKSRPCLLYLKNIHYLCRDKEGEREERRIVDYFASVLSGLETNEPYLPFMIVASTTNTNEMSTRFYSLFLYHINIEAPSEEERTSLFNALFDREFEGSAVLAKKASGFMLSDFVAMFKKLHDNLEMRQKLVSVAECNIEELKSDTTKFIEAIRAEKSGTLTNVKVDKVSWSDVGGLENVKQDIFDTIELPMKFPHLFKNNLRRSGLLFYGPPGCGKTLLAKAIATEFSLNFYSVKGPELINMYVGQSEENVRETFKTARRMAPCVVFFDEIDSLAPNRGRSGDSGGVMDRIVSQLLSELDGMHDNTDVFIIAATNRPDLLDSALLRPGRFDKLIYVGVPEDREGRLKLLKAVTRKMNLAPDIRLEDIIDEIPLNLTGADFKALASDAAMCSVKRLINEHENVGKPLNAETVVVTVNDFKEAVNKCVPSVSFHELERYKAIQSEIHNK